LISVDLDKHVGQCKVSFSDISCFHQSADVILSVLISSFISFITDKLSICTQIQFSYVY